MSLSKNCIKKVKRPTPDWYAEMKYQGDPEIECRYFAIWCKLGCKSKNRAAYLALKTYYSTTALNSFRWLGGHLEDYE